MPTKTPDSTQTIHPNAVALQKEMDWFEAVLAARLAGHLEQRSWQIEEIAPPTHEEYLPSTYAAFLRQYALSSEERLVLLLALVSHLRPQALDPLLVRNPLSGRGFAEFGGCPAKHHAGFLPTWETAIFLIAGSDLERRIGLITLFQCEHVFFRKGILTPLADGEGETLFAAPLRIAHAYLHQLTTGEHRKSGVNAYFPARRISTALRAENQMLAPAVRTSLGALLTWARFDPETWAAQGLTHLNPGYRALFHGPAGTGKTLAAMLIGQQLGAEVYCIDLAAIAGNMVENAGKLARIVEHATISNWILVLDKADALFGAHTEAPGAEGDPLSAAWLLRYLEDFPGIIILTSRLHAKVEDMFANRFHALIHFPMPDAEQRLLLWQHMLGKQYPVNTDLVDLAERYALSGGDIANAIRHALVRARQLGHDPITTEDLDAGIAQVLPETETAS